MLTKEVVLGGDGDRCVFELRADDRGSNNELLRGAKDGSRRSKEEDVVDAACGVNLLFD